MRTIFYIFILLSITSCTTKITSLTADKDSPLDENTGYLLLGIETDKNLKELYISGEKRVFLSHQDIRRGTNYILVPLPAGEYYIDRVRLGDYWSFITKDEEFWGFEVKEQHISYAGHLELVSIGYWVLLTDIELVNRSSESLEFLEQKYPNILKQRKMHYGGPGSDKFFETVNALKGDQL